MFVSDLDLLVGRKFRIFVSWELGSRESRKWMGLYFYYCSRLEPAGPARHGPGQSNDGLWNLDPCRITEWSNDVAYSSY
jgi:hypothetical protein